MTIDRRSWCLTLMVGVSLFACSSTADYKRDTYYMLQGKQCMDQKGVPVCEQHRTGYEDYESERARTLED